MSMPTLAIIVDDDDNTLYYLYNGLEVNEPAFHLLSLLLKLGINIEST